MNKIKKILLTIVIIIVGLGIIGALAGDDETSTNTETLASETKENTNEDTKEDTKIEIPNAATTYIQLGQSDTMPFEVSDKSIEFIKNHPDFFPGSDQNKGAISDFVNQEAGYPQLNKNISKYEGELAFVSGNVIDIEESEDGSLTYIHISDDINYGNYVLYYLGTLADVYEGDYVEAYFLPFDTVTFENLSNAYTEAIVGGAAIIGFSIL